MSDPYVGEIRVFGCNYAPRGWALCNGQLLPISQNQALFALLGTTYGGDGRTTFALPDLRGRTPLHTGNGVSLGQSAGEETHTLIVSEMPMHTHLVSGTNADAAAGSPAGGVWAASGANPFSTAAPNTAMNGGSLAASGNSQPHSNMQPYLTMNFCIALTGIFPSRN